MKILHTADWHLGKKLDFYSRMEEQYEVMDEICEIADREEVDLIIVAGDLFDAFNPPTDAIDLLYKTLKQLTNNGQRPVIAIAGNHDSPPLIDAPDTLARECGIIMIGYPNAVVQKIALPDFEIKKSEPGFIEIKIEKFNYPVRIVHTAYANEVQLKTYLGEEDKEVSLNQILKENWQAIADKYCDEKGVNLLTTHLFMMNKGGETLEEPDGEKPIKVGNADLIYAEIVPKQIQYTALGHLHRYISLGTDENPIVYSSSPLCYSFSEAGQQKYVAIVEAQPGENAIVNRVELKAGKELVRKTFDEIDLAVEWLEENQNTLVELTIESDTFITANDRKRIAQAHYGIIHLIPKVRNTGNQNEEIQEINLNQNIQDLFKDYFKSKKDGQEPNEEIMELFNEILNEE